MADQRLRVLHVIARMNVGGPAHQVAHLLERLDRDRFDVRLVTGSVEAGEDDYLALRGLDTQHAVLPGLGRSVRFGGDASALLALRGHLRAFRPHILHTHTAKAGVLGRLAAGAGRAAGRSPLTVHTYHGHLLQGYFSPRTTQAITALERLLARRTDRLVAVGARVRDELLAAGVGRAEQYTVIPPGVDAPAVIDRAAAREALGLPADGLVVGFAGRLTQVKRPDRFVEVARRVSARRADVRFAVAGDGDAAEETRAQARRSGVDVAFLGWRPDVERFYRACDVLVLTSDNEGMPVSLIEAAGHGLPAVATDVGSVAEVVADARTGFVRPPSADALAEAVLVLLDDAELRARMGSAGEARAADLFGIDRAVAATAALYEAVVAGR